MKWLLLAALFAFMWWLGIPQGVWMAFKHDCAETHRQIQELKNIVKEAFESNGDDETSHS